MSWATPTIVDADHHLTLRARLLTDRLAHTQPIALEIAANRPTLGFEVRLPEQQARDLAAQILSACDQHRARSGGAGT